MSQPRTVGFPSARPAATPVVTDRSEFTGCPWHDVKAMLRQVSVEGSKAYFDTNASAHHHFFVEGENELVDIPCAEVIVGKTPIPPEGFEIERVDVVVRLRRKS